MSAPLTALDSALPTGVADLPPLRSPLRLFFSRRVRE